MDEDTRRMMADLGDERRDAVSAPSADSKGREIREDSRREAAALRDWEDRKRKIEASSGDSKDDARRILAWYSGDHFESDGTGKGLTNRFSGQGHRAELASRLHRQHDEWDDTEARVGEERRLHLERHGRRPNETSSRSVRSGQSAFLEHVLGGREPKGPRPSQGIRGRAESRNASTRTRAPSPRPSGTVRFEPSGQRVELNAHSSTSVPSKTPKSNEPLALVPTTANANKQVAANAPHSDTQANGTTSSGSGGLRSNAAPSPPRGANPATGTPSASAILSERTYDEVCHKRALWYAANPGEECNKYHEKFPDRLQYLEPARKVLVKQAMEHVKRGHERDIVHYIETHKERRWMIDAAKKAKELTENASDEDIETYRSANPDHKPFLDAAAVIFSRRAFSSHISTTSNTTTTTNDGQASSTDISKKSFETAMSVPEHGSLCASLFNSVGEFLGSHQISVKAPVQAVMSISTRKDDLDPRELVTGLEEMAQSMFDRFQKLEIGDGREAAIAEDEEL